MPELKLTSPLPEIDTARLRPGLRARPKRLHLAADAGQERDQQTEKPKT